MRRSRSLLNVLAASLVLVMGPLGWYAPFHWAEHLTEPGAEWMDGESGGDPGTGLGIDHCLSCTASTGMTARFPIASPWQVHLRGVASLTPELRIASWELLPSHSPRAPPTV